MKKKFDFIESAMHHRQIVILLVALLSLLGIYGLLNMPKNEFPDFTVRQGLVIGVYPGATSEEVETQLAQPLEKFLWSFKEIKKRNTYSQSRNGIVYIFVELNDNIKDKDAFWNRFKHGLAQFKSQLPQGVAALIANDDFGDTSAMLLTLESDSKTYHELEDQLDRLTDQLRTIESISNLRTYGLQKEQIGVYIDRDKLSAYGLNSATLLSTLFSQGFTTMSGSVDNGKLVAPIHISESYTRLNDLRQQIVYSDPQGHVIRLGDIATLKREYPDPSSYIKNNGKKSVMLSMEMNKGYNIVQFGTDVNKVLTQYEKTLPKDIHVYKITDQSQVVGDSVINFLKELLIAIIAVIIVIMLLLPMRVASVAASTIPITIFISLGLFYIGGIELNTVTLAALIITLGMIVDNSIVIIDCYLEKLDQGVSRWHAASASAKEFIGSIFSATLAISITFFPFLFTLKGMFQDFVKLFPIAVTLILTISLLVAILLVPYMQYYFIRKGIKKDSTKPQRKTILDYIQQTYEKVLSVCFKHPFYTIECGVLILILGIILFIHLPQRLMPIAERNQFAVEFYLPTGTAIERTTAVADSLEHILRRDSRVVSVTSFLGEGSPRFQTSYAPGLPGSNFAQFIVNTESTKATEELLDEYAPKYTNYFPEAWVRFKQLEYSDATSPIEIRFSGEDLTALRAVGDSTLQLLRQNPKLTLVRSNFLESTSGFYVDLKEDETNRLGIPKTLVSMNLATRFGDGLPLTTLWEGDYPVSVMLKDNYTGKQSSQSLENTQISGLLPGLNVPLRQIADIKPDWTDGQIVRRNGIRTLSILADVTRGTNVSQTSQEILAQLKQRKYPEGVTFSMGGQMEKDGESLPQILGGLTIAIGIIFMILLFHFRKINLTLLILLSLLFAFPGTAIGIAIMGQAMSLTGILGVVSLMGIIVRNGIIMIDYAEELRIKEKLPARLAAMQSASRRMRPIFLTSAAASMGVIPMIISRDPMWGPMGTVVCFGTIISMVLIITLLPVAYWLIFRVANAKKKKRNLKKTTSMKRYFFILHSILILCIAQPLSAEAQYTLKQCREQALQNNRKLKEAQLDKEAAGEQRKEAFTNYFPQVSSMAGVFKANKDLVQLPGMSFIDGGYVANITATQPLFAGGQIINGYKMTKIGEEVKAIQLKQTEEEICITTEAYYYQLLALLEKRHTLEVVNTQLKQIYLDVSNSYQAGISKKNDVLNVQLKLNEVASNQLAVNNGIQLSKMLLAQYIGLTTDSFQIDCNLLKELSPAESYKVDHEAALTQTKEYQLLNKNIEANHLEYKLKVGAQLPTVAVGAGYTLHNLMDEDQNFGMLFATVKVPISQWWGGSHAIKRKKISEQIAKLDKEDNAQLLLIRMQQTYDNLAQAYQQVQLAESSKATATENLRLNQDYYHAGTVALSDLLDAQTQQQQAFNQYTDAAVSYLNSRSAYLRATNQMF